MYKDKDKQREAQRNWVRQKRAKEGSTEPGSTKSVTQEHQVPVSDQPKKVYPLLKRGKDIECFEDLPLDVQQTIDRISDGPEEKTKRTALAIKYQHAVPAKLQSLVMRSAACMGIEGRGAGLQST